MTVTDVITSDAIAEAIVASAGEVSSSMLGSELTGIDRSGELTFPCDGVLSVIGLTGKWVGSGYLVCSSASACRLASSFLMSDPACGVTDEVLDAVGEITNMIVGTVKNSLEDSLGPLQLSIPTVIHGKNISTHFMKSVLSSTVICSSEGWSVTLRICLTKAEPSAHS
jgi:chemotaxis protein CheX